MYCNDMFITCFQFLSYDVMRILSSVSTNKYSVIFFNKQSNNFFEKNLKWTQLPAMVSFIIFSYQTYKYYSSTLYTILYLVSLPCIVAHLTQDKKILLWAIHRLHNLFSIYEVTFEWMWTSHNAQYTIYMTYLFEFDIW